MLSITATQLPRVMECNGSVRMVGFIPDENEYNETKEEGIAAHWLVEQVVKKGFKPEELVDRQAENGYFITEDMVEQLDDYLSFIKPDDLIEHSSVIKLANAIVKTRADHISFEQGFLTISDLKFGWSIVEPERNWTLIAYAIAFMLDNPDKVIHTIDFWIYQPRPFHQDGKFRRWSINVDVLKELFIKMSNTLNNLSETLNTGKNCYKCPALATCPASRKAEMNAIDESERLFEDNLDNSLISFRLDNLKRANDVISKNLKALEEIALYRLKKGEMIRNYSLKKDLSNIRWKEFVNPENVILMTGLDLTKKTLMTPAQAKKMGVKDEVIESITEKLEKGTKLVRIDSSKKAEKLFNN